MIDTVGLVWFVIITEALYWLLMAGAAAVLIWALRREFRDPRVGRAVWLCAFRSAMFADRCTGHIVMWLIRHYPQGTQ